MWILLILQVVAAVDLETTTHETSLEHETFFGNLEPTAESIVDHQLIPSESQSEFLGALQVGRFASNRYRKKRRLTRVSVVKRIEGLTNLPSSHCLAQCLRMGNSCAAFNYARSEGVCELLEAHVCSQSGIRLNNSDAFTYFDVYDKPGAEDEGPMFKSPYCSKIGLCNPACEQCECLSLYHVGTALDVQEASWLRDAVARV
ncbi:uncharacterized protein LOC114827982 [Galendromus occidentalis]|uniref:Uncharacterized protein LOC114827982 n=1 Tax=Galendromus occidentalis TaxID=34638 RepID=A0AAJ7SFM3_9ACAR|nr:uncharacterized protein LOC114827982 [Galendromus occidentalis]